MTKRVGILFLAIAFTSCAPQYTNVLQDEFTYDGEMIKATGYLYQGANQRFLALVKNKAFSRC